MISLRALFIGIFYGIALRSNLEIESVPHFLLAMTITFFVFTALVTLAHAIPYKPEIYRPYQAEPPLPSQVPSVPGGMGP